MAAHRDIQRKLKAKPREPSVIEHVKEAREFFEQNFRDNLPDVAYCRTVGELNPYIFDFIEKVKKKTEGKDPAFAKEFIFELVGEFEIFRGEITEKQHLIFKELGRAIAKQLEFLMDEQGLV